MKANAKSPVKTKKAVHDPWDDMVLHLRKKGPEVRDAVFEGHRVDFFRGKDLVAHMKTCKEARELMENLPQDKLKGTNLDDQSDSLGHNLLRRGVFFRAERSQKTPKPGKKLLKYPKRLDLSRDNTFDAEGFYIWRFVLPTSMWMYVGSAGVVVLTIACCLFPLAPHWAKLTVLYLCLTLLGLIFFFCIVRAMVFGAVWVLFGKHLWVLPNLFSDDVGLVEAFQPWYEFEGADDPNFKAPSFSSRMLAAAAISASFYGLYTYSPETDEMAAKAQQAHKSILEMLDLYQVPKQLAGSNETLSSNLTNATGLNQTAGEVPDGSNGTSVPPMVEPEGKVDGLEVEVEEEEEEAAEEEEEVNKEEL